MFSFFKEEGRNPLLWTLEGNDCFPLWWGEENLGFPARRSWSWVLILPLRSFVILSKIFDFSGLWLLQRWDGNNNCTHLLHRGLGVLHAMQQMLKMLAICDRSIYWDITCISFSFWLLWICPKEKAICAELSAFSFLCLKRAAKVLSS